jgi:hypothetical protein
MKNNIFQSLLLLLLGSSLVFWACVKTEFDEPPVGGVPVDIQANTTIKALKALHVTPEGYDKVTEDLIIEGEVIMDDRSGNYYKTLVIQDATGGIEVKFNDASLFNSMPIGRKIYIRCKDLLLTDYNGLPQLTGSLIEENGVPRSFGLTEAQVRQKVVKGSYATTPLAPKKVSIGNLTSDMINTLIQIDDVQFTQCDAGQTYADPVTQNSLNRTLEDCDANQLLLRTSGYADFAASFTPGGKGAIVGVLGIFGQDYQLFIRNLNDVNLNGARCGSSGGTGVGGTLANISDIRALFTGTTTSAPADRKIKGVVISDRNAKNLNSRNIYLQDGTAGIVVRFTMDHCFNLGDEIEVNVSSLELSEFNKLLQVNNVPLSNALRLSTGKTVTPRKATIAEINTNYNVWESTLVEITGATITGGATLSGNKTVTDATGNIAMFTQTASSIAALATPAGPVKLTAIVSDFNGKQIILRNAQDIQQ